MPVRLSIILPVLNEAQTLESQLRQLRQAFPAAELLVVDGGSEDDSVAVAQPLCEAVMQAPRGRASQMNAGAARAQGEYLLFLHADTQPAYCEADLLQLLQQQAPDWGFAPVRLSGRHVLLRIVERAMGLRSRLTAVATGDQGLFLRRDLFQSLDGFASIPLMEDVEFSKRLRECSRPLVLPWPVSTSSRRWEERGILRTVLTMWVLRLAYVCGVSPQRLHQYYYG